MRLPTRRSEQAQLLKRQDDPYLTPSAIQSMKDELQDLEKRQRQRAILEVQRTAEMGDFSENAAYQMAKGRLRGMNARITTLQEQLKTAVPIEAGTGGRIRIGSKVSVRVNGKDTEFEIVGSQETNPSLGRISYSSPLGMALLGHVLGEMVPIRLGKGEVFYEILNVI
ncbi:MAG TPA: GreA/GreB family elongation factor [Patescibacteria group bacterium]|nr:GreA/GreB family elongation factor [Patescibacteria group bacterium]